MKGKFFPFLFLICISNLFATEQIRDSLVYNGKGYLIENQFLFEEILNEYVTENGYFDDNYASSNLWRGYRAVFEITNNQLKLKDLQIAKDTKDAEGYYIQYFENINSEEIKEKINSFYFDGILVLADGYLVDYSFFYDEYYPNYKIGEFKNNMLTKELDFKFEEMDNFISNQFEKYQNTKFYRKDLRDCRKRREKMGKIYKEKNLPQMVEYDQNFDCSEFIKSFLFENPKYSIIYL